jgi:hypothetical protein
MNVSHKLVHKQTVAFVDDVFDGTTMQGYTELSQKQKYYCLFTNFRYTGGSQTGIRLTHFGDMLLRKAEKPSYEFALKERLTGTMLIALDENMVNPYHVDNGSITFYGKDDAAWFKMGGGSLSGFIEMI